MLYPGFFAAVCLSHWTLLRLPYFWDEGGYYIPAALDFFHTGTLIPRFTNAHPPLPNILLGTLWHLVGYHILATRIFVCSFAALGLLAVYRLARNLLGAPAAIATTLLTGLYPVWFAQSTLAHADIFSAAFTFWAFALYLESADPADTPTQAIHPTSLAHDSAQWLFVRSRLWVALLFTLAVLSKETAILQPATLAALELFLLLRHRSRPSLRRAHTAWLAALCFPLLPLAVWYAYHFHHTGYIFGNPEFLRYNATANLDTHRIALCLYHRFLHLFLHMNMFVPVACAVAVQRMPSITSRARLSRPVLNAIAAILTANWIAFSVLGGALLTRYLLPMYPLVLLVCVAEWQRHLRTSRWPWIAALSAAAFLAGLWINPPYAFAPEDNLTYRDMIVLHQQAVTLIAQRWPQATVLTAWPAISELERPELGYAKVPIHSVAIQNFSREQIESSLPMERSAANPDGYDTVLLFSTKWAPPASSIDLSRRNHPSDALYFDFHEDVLPAQAASILHGEVLWQASIRNEWGAVLRFPHLQSAKQ
jgi:4-amino-4-deoxy-L-arabinose transferase-like glycosyltransferase